MEFYPPLTDEEHLDPETSGGFSDLLEVAHHLLLVAPEDAAEELHDLLVVQVVNAFDDPGQEQLYGQVQVPVEFI